MSQQICPDCDGKGGELMDVVIDPEKNGEYGNIRKELIRCGRCDGSGAIEVPDDDEGDNGRLGRRR